MSHGHLLQTYQVAYVVVKAANSPRPGNWILEKSLDGRQFTAWQYFAETNSDCLNLYGVRASPGASVESRRDDQVHCTSHYSQLDPLENGEVSHDDVTELDRILRVKWWVY